MQPNTYDSAIDWKRYRKRLLINPRFQYSFLRYFVGIAAGTLIIFYAAKILFFRQFGSHLTALGFAPDHALFGVLARQSRVMDLAFAVAALVETVFLGWVGLRVSHRVAGPLHRLREEMLRTARIGPQAEVVHLKFRDGDYFGELADAYNEHVIRTRKTH